MTHLKYLNYQDYTSTFYIKQPQNSGDSHFTKVFYIKVEKRTLVFSDFCCQHLIKIKPIFSPYYLKIHL